MAATLKIGWARQEISLDEPVVIPGQMHMRISERIHDPLYTTALVLDGGEGQDIAIFCSSDITSIRGNIVKPIAGQVHARRPEIPEDAVIINATHTHSSLEFRPTPDISPDGRTIYPGWKVREHLISKIVDTICQAWDARKPGGIGYGYGYAVVAHSRRTLYLEDMGVLEPSPVAPNGHGVMYGNTRHDQFASFEAGADHFLNLMFTFDEDKKLTGMIVNIPCPSQLSEQWTMQSADYWCEVREEVAKEFGTDVFVLPQCAAAGDLSPRILHYREAQARRFRLKYDVELTEADATKNGGSYNRVMCERRDIAERVIAGIKDVYSWAKNDIQYAPTIRHERRIFPISRRIITDEERQWCEDAIQIMAKKLPSKENTPAKDYNFAITFYNSIKARNERILERYEEQKAEKKIDVTVHAVRVGEIAFATNRFELYMDYMHRIQARSPYLQTFIVQLCADEGGSYLATERGTANKGYSASLFCNQFSPDGGQELVEETLDMLNGLHNDD